MLQRPVLAHLLFLEHGLELWKGGVPQVTGHTENTHRHCVNGFWLVSSRPHNGFNFALITYVCGASCSEAGKSFPWPSSWVCVCRYCKDGVCISDPLTTAKEDTSLRSTQRIPLCTPGPSAELLRSNYSRSPGFHLIRDITKSDVSGDYREQRWLTERTGWNWASVTLQNLKGNVWWEKDSPNPKVFANHRL